MKNTLIYIFNPFAKINAKPLMLVGIISSVIGSLISHSNKVIYDGMIDAHSFNFITYSQAVTANFVNIIIPCILLFILSKSINPKTRMIDILNASFIYRIPFYILPFFINIPLMKNIESRINNISNLQNLHFETHEWIYMLLISVITLGILIYAIILLFNGFKTASNAKTWLQYLGFGAVVFISEVLTKLIISNII